MRLLKLGTAALFAFTLGCLAKPPIHDGAVQANNACMEYISANNLDEAEIRCNLGLELSPHYPDLWVNKGLIAQHRGQYEKAKDHYRQALRLNNEQAQAYNNLGTIYKDVDGKLGTAADHFNRALKVNPYYIEARYNLAQTLMRMEKYDEAKKQYATVIAINENLADPQHDLGLIALKQGETDEAITRLRKAVELDPTYANAWLSLGNAYAEAAKYRESSDAFTSCLEANPDSIECRNNLAIVNRKAKLLDPSLKEVQTRASTENTAPALYQLAVQFRDQGLRSEEERAYQKCLRLDGKYAPCHFGLYTIFAEDQNQKKATIACKNFLKFGSAEDFPSEAETCEKFLSANAAP